MRQLRGTAMENMNPRFEINTTAIYHDGTIREVRSVLSSGVALHELADELTSIFKGHGYQFDHVAFISDAGDFAEYDDE
jgi:hypothetical protein